MRIIRQGDVLVREIQSRSPSGRDVREDGRVILAHGEATGHVHELVAADSGIGRKGVPARFVEEDRGGRFLFVKRTCVLKHQEHDPITIEPGCYEVIRQREYAPETDRPVSPAVAPRATPVRPYRYVRD